MHLFCLSLKFAVFVNVSSQTENMLLNTGVESGYNHVSGELAKKGDCASDPDAVPTLETFITGLAAAPRCRKHKVTAASPCFPLSPSLSSS